MASEPRPTAGESYAGQVDRAADEAALREVQECAATDLDARQEQPVEHRAAQVEGEPVPPRQRIGCREAIHKARELDLF
jgi:hypothetical protein